MKRILSISLWCLLLVALAVSPGLGQTVQEILKKIIEAQGGKEVFESVKDLTFSGNLEMPQQGVTGSITLYKKEPDKRRVDVETMGRVSTQAYDGVTAWRNNIQTGTIEELSEEEAKDMKREALPLASILYPEKYGISFAYKGKEKLDSKDYFVLEQTYSDGFKVTLYVDPETYLTHKSKAHVTDPTIGEIEVEQTIADYKKVDGLIIAHKIVTYINGQEYYKITITKASLNTGLEDSLFKK